MRKILMTAPLALAFVACGSDIPGASQVRADLQSPSGSIRSKRTVAGAYVTNDASGIATGIGGSFSPIGAHALTAAGVEKIGPARLMGPQFARLQAQFQGRSVRGLEDVSSCLKGDEINRQLSAQLLGGSQSGDFSVDIDLGTCAGIGLSGKIGMSGTFVIGTSEAKFTVRESLDAVCETSSGACMTGDVDLEASISAMNLEMILGWKVQISQTKIADPFTLTTKGGLRIAGSGKSATLEYVVYVLDENGKEVSLVLTIDDRDYSIRGAEGSITCKISADGAGKCTGDIDWDAAFVGSLERDPSFNGSKR